MRKLELGLVCLMMTIATAGCGDDSDTAAGGGAGSTTCSDCDAPLDGAAMFSFLMDGDYTGWDKESAAHSSTGPHGSSVLVYLSPKLSASLAASNTSHDRGSAVVKEFLDAGGAVSGWAAWVKADADSDGGNNIYWYENFSASTNNPVADAFGPAGCTNCHSGGNDFLLIPYPLQ